jgi:hypothetical protein
MELTTVTIEQVCEIGDTVFKFVTVRGQGTTLFRSPKEFANVVPSMDIVSVNSEGKLVWRHLLGSGSSKNFCFSTVDIAQEWVCSMSADGVTINGLA